MKSATKIHGYLQVLGGRIDARVYLWGIYFLIYAMELIPNDLA